MAKGSAGEGGARSSASRGARVALDAASRPKRDGDGTPPLEERLRDATARLEEAERVAQAKSDFLSIVSHELQQPVGVIAGFASLLADHARKLSEADSDKLLEGLTRQSQRLARLIRDLLDLSRMEAGEFSVRVEPADLARVVSGAVDDAPPPEGKTVTVDRPAGLWVLADPQRLGQVLVNLLSNAYRYGGSAIRVAAEEASGDVVMTVTDDGEGVPSDVVPVLFDRYRRGRNAIGGGTGLGLAIARGFVESFGGRIWFEPAHPQGARFTVLLRSAPTAARAARAPRAPSVKPGRARKGDRVPPARILIVDDEPDTLFLLRVILERQGHEVVEAGHGAEALNRLADAPVDMIITDLMMPVMDGRELVERLRADPATAEIPIMLASANPDVELAVDAMLVKPFPPRDVIASVEQLLGGAA
jgi:CheY-like chemotaxis protein/nitrogen-specific signal transduction histidine kinase